MPRIKLTTQAIRRLPAPDPSGKQVLYWDAEQRGFGLLISGTTNSKSYVVQREVNGRSRRVSLGTVYEFEQAGRTLEDARHEAAEMVLKMRKGIDPKRRRGPEANATLQQILDKYLAEQDLAENSKTLYRSLIQRYLKDWLDRPLRELTAEMVEGQYRRIKAKVARAYNVSSNASEPGSATANTTIRALKVIWNYGQDIIPELPPNPVKLKRWYSVPERERHIPGDLLPAFYEAADNLPNRTMRDYILLLLFTGLRRNEAATLRWADIDFSQRLIRLPGKRTKSGRKLDLPMSDYVHALLVARRAIGFENEYVFPGPGRTGHVREPKSAFSDIEAACGTRISSHDLRRTFVTVASLCPIPAMALPALVNHSPGKSITADYSRIGGADLAGAMQIITDRLKELCGVSAPEGALPLRKKIPYS